MKWTAGAVAFLIGFFGSLLVGLLGYLKVFEAGAIVTIALIVAGAIIGLLNIKDKEAVPVMVATLVIGAGAGILATLPMVGALISALLMALATVMLPAGIVVAVKTLYEKAN